MRLCSLYSGSSGNAIYVGSNHTNILVDIGVSKKKVVQALYSIDILPEEINAILITHEHLDHISGLGVFLRQFQIPVYATKKTIEAIKNTNCLGKVDPTLFHEIIPERSFKIEEFRINPISIWHDAADPVCYTLTDGTKKISIATDMGDYDNHIVDALSDADAMLIEANHDIRMLEVGPYSYSLKQRVLGKYGHLSNERSGQLIKSLLNNHVKGVYLGHLSLENNYPDLALETVKTEIYDNPFSNDYRDFNISIASRLQCSKCIDC